MNPALKQWLNQEVYPNLSHDKVFGNLPNYTKAQYSETRYSDCPRCQRKKSFYMIDGRPMGTCDRCHVVIPWWSYLRFGRAESDAIATIASLAGVSPIDPNPDIWVQL